MSLLNDLYCKDFGEGFWFGVLVCNSLGKVDSDAIIRRLIELSDGDVSLQSSPEEVIMSMESQYGPMPEKLKEITRKYTSGESRKKTDESHKKSADRVITWMADGFDNWKKKHEGVK